MPTGRADCILNMNTQIVHASALTFLGLLVLATGCARHEPPQAPAPSLPPALESQKQPAPELVAAQLVAAGFPTSYEAHFAQGRLTSIAESRTATGLQGDDVTGEYKFQGARLLAYSGAALDSPTALVLRFDPQGRIAAARAGDKEASAGQIAAIRTRAQLLRSHALAQYASRTHSAW